MTSKKPQSEKGKAKTGHPGKGGGRGHVLLLLFTLVQYVYLDEEVQAL